MGHSKKIYIASSWKNEYLLLNLAGILRHEGHEVDLFCDDSTGRFRFCYTDIPGGHENMNAVSFLNTPEALRAFHEDRKWLDWCDVCLLVLPSGRSSHLEAGYAVGRGKKLYILGGYVTGEFDVMYGFAEQLFDFSQLNWLLEELKRVA